MKYIFIFLILIECISSCFGQENLTLSLELVNPSGKIDRKSYFLARLKNHNDSLNISVVYGGDGYFSYLRCSYFKVIYDVTGKSEYMTNKKPFFNYEGKYHISIDPSSEYQAKLPLFEFIDSNGGNSVLPLSSKTLKNIKRIRIKLENLQYMPIMKKTDGSKHFYPKQSINLYSNWLGINGRKFLPELLKDIQPDD